MYIPAIVDVQYPRIARIKIFKPLRKLGPSCHEIVEQLSRLELTEITDSQESQQERYICQRPETVVFSIYKLYKELTYYRETARCPIARSTVVSTKSCPTVTCTLPRYILFH